MIWLAPIALASVALLVRWVLLRRRLIDRRAVKTLSDSARARGAWAKSDDDHLPVLALPAIRRSEARRFTAPSDVPSGVAPDHARRLATIDAWFRRGA